MEDILSICYDLRDDFLQRGLVQSHTQLRSTLATWYYPLRKFPADQAFLECCVSDNRENATHVFRQVWAACTGYADSLAIFWWQDLYTELSHVLEVRRRVSTDLMRNYCASIVPAGSEHKRLQRLWCETGITDNSLTPIFADNGSDLCLPTTASAVIPSLDSRATARSLMGSWIC